MENKVRINNIKTGYKDLVLDCVKLHNDKRGAWGIKLNPKNAEAKKVIDLNKGDDMVVAKGLLEALVALNKLLKTVGVPTIKVQ